MLSTSLQPLRVVAVRTVWCSVYSGGQRMHMSVTSQHLEDDSSLDLHTSLENYGLGLKDCGFGLGLGLGLEGSGLVNIPG